MTMMQPGAGDAAGMRHAAAQIGAKADLIVGLVRQLDAQVSAMTYAGPAADRFRAEVADQRANMLQTQGILRNCVEILNNAATAAAAGQPY
jgi:uncharacterized protein YukE